MAVDIVNIADGGDVILVVGQGSNILRLKVHSFILRTASEIFKVMFGPDFVEGKGLSYANPKEVLLEDDDPETMRTICQVIHFRNDMCDESISVDKLWKIVQVVDKYFLNEALKFHIDSWLSKWHFKGSEDHIRNLKCGILLEYPNIFKNATKSIVLESTTSILSLLNSEMSPELMKVLGKQILVNLSTFDSKVSQCHWKKSDRN